MLLIFFGLEHILCLNAGSDLEFFISESKEFHNGITEGMQNFLNIAVLVFGKLKFSLFLSE